jgi:DNA invertase Pin-like site-specific DNA recombinase
MKKTALIYARVSTIDRQDYSRQVNDLTELIVRHGFSENQIEVFAEKISGLKRNDERPELTRMLNLVEKNPEDYIIYTTEISRIGRDPSDTRKVIDRLTDLKVPVYIKTLQTATVNENGERNATMSIILQVLIEYANMELQTFKERSKSGMRNKSKMGKWLGGVMIPYGYYCDENKFLHIEPEESEIIKRIFKLYSDGFGIKVISNILNADGVLTRTNKTHENKTLKFRNFPSIGSLSVLSTREITTLPSGWIV